MIPRAASIALAFCLVFIAPATALSATPQGPLSQPIQGLGFGQAINGEFIDIPAYHMQPGTTPILHQIGRSNAITKAVDFDDDVLTYMPAGNIEATSTGLAWMSVEPACLLALDCLHVVTWNLDGPDSIAATIYGTGYTRASIVWDESPGASVDCSTPCAYAFTNTGDVLRIDLNRGLALETSTHSLVNAHFGASWVDGSAVIASEHQFWVFDPDTMATTRLTSWPENILVGDKDPIVHDGAVWVLGGVEHGNRAVRTVLRLDPSADVLEERGYRLPFDVNHLASTWIGDKLYLLQAGLNQLNYGDQVIAVELDNSLPEVALDGPDAGTTGQVLAWSGTAIDPDGTITSTSWNFGDGGSSTGTTATHTYTQAGTYTVQVTVTDNEGATASDSITITVSNPPPPPPPPPQPNTAPTAAFTASADILKASFTSTSTDPDNDALTHTWTFGDRATSTETNPTHHYATAGIYTVKLIVNDGEYTDEATQTVTIQAPTAPAASFTLSSTTAVEGTTITATSTSTEGTGSHTYTWFLDGAQHGSGASTSFNAAVGAHTVKLVVQNEYDQSSEAVKSFTATAKPAAPTPTPSATATSTPSASPTPAPTEAPNTADKESPAGFFLIPALLAVAWLSRRR